MSKKAKIISDSMTLSSVRVVVMISGFVKSIVLARLFVPSAYGLLNFVVLILSYSNYASAGLKSAALREVPYYLGKQDKKEALAIQNVTITTNMFISVIASVVILIIAFAGNFKPDMKLALTVAAILFSVYSLYTFYEMKATFLKDFKLIARFRLLDVLLKLFIVIAAGFLGGIRWALLSLILIQLMVLFYISRKINLEYVPVIDIGRLKSLSRIGIPLFLGSLAWTLFLTLDSLMVMKYLGRDAFGYYSLAALFLAFFYGLSSDTGTIVYRHSQEHYGKTDESYSLRRYIEEPTRLVAYCFPMIIGIIIFYIDIPTRLVLPNYIPSAGVIKILIYAYFFVFLSIFHGTLLTTMNKQVLHFFIRLFFIFFLAGVNIIMIKRGYGILGVALGTTISWIAYSITLFFVTVKYIVKQANSRISYILKMLLPVSYASLLIFLLFIFQGQLTGQLKSILPGALFIMGYLPLLVYINKKTDILGSLLNLVGKAA